MNEGLVTAKSAHDFDTTFKRLTEAIAARSMTLFAVIDHADGAHLAGLELEPTLLVVFGNAKGGTPLMRRNRRTAIDLPLKALVWQDETGVYVTVNDPHWIARRHDVDGALAEGLASMLVELTEAAAR